MVTKEDNPVYRYAKRAFFIIDKTGTVKFAKVMDNSLDLLSADEALQEQWCRAGRAGLRVSGPAHIQSSAI